MKKLVLLLIIIAVFVSCGPKRMGCGARGICQVSENKMKDQSSLNQIISVN